MQLFKEYEKMPGGDPDQIEVLIRENVLEKHLERFNTVPEIQHAPLTHMVQEQLALPDIRTISLYDGGLVGGTGELKRFALGGHVPGSHTVYSAVGVNGPHYYMPRREYDADDYDPTATMPKLIRNVVALSDVRHHRATAWGERIGYILRQGDLVSAGYRNGRRATEQELFREHKNDIRFRVRASEA